MFQVIILSLIWRLSFGQHLSHEAIYTINTKKVLHTVSEKFLSISIDPAVLLTGLNLSDSSFQMAKKLSPGYIRIAGPSTQFVKYQDESWNDAENGMLVVTPTMWFGINEWLASANLTPVFGINDGDTTREGWNPQDTRALLDVSDKFNVSCYWQLGYDCSNKTDEQYGTDLRRLRHALDAFPDKMDQWKIVGSDLSRCAKEPKKTLDKLGDVLAAVVREHTFEDEHSFLDSLNDIHARSRVPVWTTSPKSLHPVSFASAIEWAKQMGDAGKSGYDVILRQPRLHEIFSETPPFWVSALHKLLMGRNVLDVKTAMIHPELGVYAHCTRHQNDFIRSGAMTVFVVNNCTRNHTILLKYGAVLLKNAEVQSYIFTAESEKATEIFLNGEKLNLGSFTGDKLNILPKLRRARIMNYLSLFLPPKSIGFFVLPGAQIPVCANEEADLKLLIEEIREDQNIPFADNEASVEVTSRFVAHKSPTLRELQRVMEKELASDERYYNQMKIKKKNEIDGRNLFLKRIRHKQNEDIRRPEEPKTTESRHKEEPKKILELELSSGEIRKVLADRAKIKAAKKNILFTSGELEEIMHKATEKFLKNKNMAIRIRKKSKREAPRDKKDINMRLLKRKSLVGDTRKLLRETLRDTLRNRRARLRTTQPEREKRDINMDLLKIKTELLHDYNKTKKSKNRFKNNEEKQATIREPGEISGELIELDREEKEEEIPVRDVFAQLADSEEVLFTSREKAKIGFKSKNLFNLHKGGSPKIEIHPIKYEPEEIGFLENDFEVNSEPDLDDVDTNFDCIHEFFGKNIKSNDKKNTSELWEVGLKPVTKRVGSHLPSIKNRAKESEANLREPKMSVEDYAEKSASNDQVYMENDYEDLESDESNPVRLKRDTNALNINPKLSCVVGKGYNSAKLKIGKNRQFKIHKKKVKRISRSILGDNSFNKRYKSLTERLKVWKPFDVLTLKDARKKTKRSIDHDVDSVENEIGKFMDEMTKQTNLDTESGDYQLVFPNKDKIEVTENHGDTELKLVFHGDSTCPTTVQDATTPSNIQKISKIDSDNVWDKLCRKFSKFLQSLSAKLRKCIMEDLLK